LADKDMRNQQGSCAARFRQHSGYRAGRGAGMRRRGGGWPMGGNVQTRPRPGRRAVLLGMGAMGVGAALPRIAGAAAGEHATLYEEDPDDPKGVSVAGSAVWRVEKLPSKDGRPQELAIHADIAVPERDMLLQWTMRRNGDKKLPATHTVDFVFTLPEDFRNRGVSNVPGILMKESEDERGMPLAGLAVKVTSGYFLFGLSAVAKEAERNMRLLKERSWLSVPIVYENGRRAILVFAKGESGARAFDRAFATWGSAAPVRGGDVVTPR
jgi:hypothetical protein